MSVQIFQCQAGDWVGLYVDGELKAEGHSVSLYDLKYALGAEVVCDDEGKAGEYLDAFGGRCPRSWTEIEEVMAGPVSYLSDSR